MKYKIEQIDSHVECCFVYIDNVSSELKDLIHNNILEIVKGKLAVERVGGEHDEDYQESFQEAAKCIYKKIGPTNRIGVVGELLFHSLLRTDELSKKYLSSGPTIGYADSYAGMFKGFDGCYYDNESIWIAEVKSKLTISDLNEDNKKKAKEASRQIKNEANDTVNNRWQRAKEQVYFQLSKLEIDDSKIFKLLNKKNRRSYNQMIGTLLICNNCDFDKKYVKGYVDELFHKEVDRQKILMICIRSFDYDKIIDYIEKEMCIL